MRKRRANGLGVGFIALAIVIGGVVMLAKALISPGGIAFVTICGLVAGGAMWSKHKQKQARIAYLHGKYGDPQIVMRILSRSYWHGQTVEQLRDSLGMPHSVDKNLLKTRKREVWKYHPTGVNRYRLRITLDDDVVVGSATRTTASRQELQTLFGRNFKTIPELPSHRAVTVFRRQEVH